MSIAVMTHVWKHSQQKGSYLLTLLAIADYADDNGRAYPSIKTLAAKTRLSERNVQYVLHKLIESRELTVEHGAGPYRCNVFHLALTLPSAMISPAGRPPIDSERPDGAKFSPAVQEPVSAQGGQGAKPCHEKVQPLAPNPSLKPPKDPSGFSFSLSTKEKKAELQDETSAWTKPAVILPPVTDRPDDVLTAAHLTLEEYADLADIARSHLIAEGTKAFCLTKPVIEAQMVKHLLHGGEIPLLTRACTADPEHRETLGCTHAGCDDDGVCPRCGEEVTLTLVGQ